MNTISREALQKIFQPSVLAFLICMCADEKPILTSFRLERYKSYEEIKNGFGKLFDKILWVSARPC